METKEIKRRATRLSKINLLEEEISNLLAKIVYRTLSESEALRNEALSREVEKLQEELDIQYGML